jgi:hypothetical protein
MIPMKRLISLIIFFVSFFNLVKAQNICECEPTTEKNSQHRSEAKHEEDYDHFVLKTDTVTVSYISLWEKKYKRSTTNIKRTGNPESMRKNGTPEDTLYILKGYMWFVKIEENDCDFHIEIGPTNALSNRIVVEVPRENLALQKKIKQHLDGLGEKILNCGTSSIKKAHFDKPIPCVVTGLGFYDVSHKPNTNHGDIHTKKYSWELHPVKDILFN